MTVTQKPDFFTKRVFNPLLNLLMRAGLSFRGSQILTVRGRKTGKRYRTPVNPLSWNGDRYLVAPRGTTGWVRNIRASGEGELRLGRRNERIHVEEVPDGAKVALLREYLRHWRWETGKFFGLPADPADEDIAGVAPNHPVFRITGG